MALGCSQIGLSIASKYHSQETSLIMILAMSSPNVSKLKLSWVGKILFALKEMRMMGNPQEF